MRIRRAPMIALVAAVLTLPACGSGSQPGKDLAGNSMGEGKTPTASAPLTPDASGNCPAGTFKLESSATCVPGSKPSEEPATTAPEGPKVFAIGYTATIFNDDNGQHTNTATVMIGKPTVTIRARDQYSDKPKNGQFLIFPVTVRAIGTETFDINPFDFYVRDAEGNRYQYGDGSMYIDDREIDATTLNPQEQIKGILVFDAPKAAHEVVYAPLTQAIGSWKF